MKLSIRFGVYDLVSLSSLIYGSETWITYRRQIENLKAYPPKLSMEYPLGHPAEKNSHPMKYLGARIVATSSFLLGGSHVDTTPSKGVGRMGIFATKGGMRIGHFYPITNENENYTLFQHMPYEN